MRRCDAGRCNKAKAPIDIPIGAFFIRGLFFAGL